MRDNFKIIPVLLAGILHAAIFVGMVFAYDWSRPVLPVMPLAIKGTLVLAESLVEVPPIVEEVIEPEPEPDNSEQLRIEAEEKKRQQDLRLERERISREEEAERQRKLADEKERKRREEAETEKRRQEAERKRLEDMERQRAENERKRKEAQDAERRRQLDLELQAEQNRIDAMKAGALARYQFRLSQAVKRNWIQPPSAVQGLSCEVLVRQSLGGDVINVVIGSCNGDEAVKRSIEAAVNKATPLPLPGDPNLFDRNLRFLFEPTE